MVAVAGGIAAMSAFEAHIINVTAHIENALLVHPTELVFGTVFPQEYLTKNFTVELSGSFQEESSVENIEYKIAQKPKCWDSATHSIHKPVDYATHQCPDGYEPMLSLCPYLSKLDGDPEDQNDTSVPSYFQGASCSTSTETAMGKLSKLTGDLADLWVVDLKVPPVMGTVGQDWPAGCPVVDENDKDYGCDLWVEVTNIGTKTP